MSTSAPPHPWDASPLPIHRFTVEQYHRLGELQLLTPEDNVELLEGLIVTKMNQKPVHGFVVGTLTQWLLKNLPQGWIGRCQLPITLQHSEPEPDLALVRGAHADFRHRHPGGTDCRLLIEVADTSLLKDRAKASIYAAAGVEEYWLVNLVDAQLERMTQPAVGAYVATDVLKPTSDIEMNIGEHILKLSLNDIFEPK